MTVRRGHWARALGRVVVDPREAPASCVIAALVLVFAVASRVPSISAGVHEDAAFTWHQLLAGRPWTATTALLLPGRNDGLLVQLVAVLAVLPYLESIAGTRRTLLGYFGIGTLATVAGAGLIELMAVAGEPWAVLSRDLLNGSPSVGVVAVAVLAAGQMPPLWRSAVLLVTGFAVVVLLLYLGEPSDLNRVVAYVIAFAVIRRPVPARPGVPGGAGRGAGRGAWRRLGAPENRSIAASIAVLLSIGTVVAMLSTARFGLLAPSVVLVEGSATLSDDPVCSVFRVGDTCVTWLIWGQSFRHGAGAWVQVLPIVLLLVAAYGLARGRRAAMWLAVGLYARTFVAVAVCFLALPDRRADAFAAAPRIERLEILVQVTAVLVVHAGAIAWLLARRGSFAIRSAPREARLLAVGAVGAVVGSGLVLAFVAQATAPVHDARGARTLALAAAELALPPMARARLGGGLRGPGSAIAMTAELVLWAALLLLALRAVASPAVHGGGPTPARVREALRRGGGSTIAHMATWPGSRHWEDPETGAIVAFREVAGVALTLSEPFGAPQEPLMGIVVRFDSYARSNGLVPVWYAVDAERFGPVVRQLDRQSAQVALESVIDLAAWSTTGKKWQDVRTAISRAGRSGVRAQWTSWAELPLDVHAQLAELSQEWVAEHPLPEMAFTLGGLPELRDPDVRLMLAVDADGGLQGALSWLPVWSGGAVVGYTLDFMRRRHGAMPGVVEFLVAMSAERMREDGIATMSLSGAPLARHPDATTEGGDVDALLDFLARRLEPVYGFSSLHRFKQKFQPRVRPWLLVYPTPLDLPAVGIAVLRSYLPALSARQALYAVRELGGRHTAGV